MLLVFEMLLNRSGLQYQLSLLLLESSVDDKFHEIPIWGSLIIVGGSIIRVRYDIRKYLPRNIDIQTFIRLPSHRITLQTIEFYFISLNCKPTSSPCLSAAIHNTPTY
jgi:hypothetical protein